MGCSNTVNASLSVNYHQCISIIFDILEQSSFQKYTTCLVFLALLICRICVFCICIFCVCASDTWEYHFNILEQSSFQKFTTCWVFLLLRHMLYLRICVFCICIFCICIFVFVSLTHRILSYNAYGRIQEDLFSRRTLYLFTRSLGDPDHKLP